MLRMGTLLSDLFITEEAFEHLKSGADGIPYFWDARADALDESPVRSSVKVANQP